MQIGLLHGGGRYEAAQEDHDRPVEVGLADGLRGDDAHHWEEDHGDERRHRDRYRLREPVGDHHQDDVGAAVLLLKVLLMVKKV